MIIRLNGRLNSGSLKNEKATKMKKNTERVAGWLGFRQFER